MSKSASNVLKGVGVVGKIFDAGLAIKKAIEHPTAGNITVAVIKVTIAALNANPIFSAVTTALEWAGLFDW